MRKKKNILKSAIAIAIGYALHFPFRLVEDAFMGWLNSKFPEWGGAMIQWITSNFILWVLPLLVAFGLVWLAYWSGTRERTESVNAEGVQPIVKAKDDYADIQVKPQVAQNLAVIEVINSGVDANFTVKAIVVKGIPPKTSYTMCWDSPPHLEHPIKKGDKSTIIVAEKTSAITETPGIVANGLAIHKYGISGVERVEATTQELSNQVKHNIRYPTMAKPVDDSCTIEITITSTPPLLNAFENRKYIVKIDHEQGHKLLITPLPELETHKIRVQRDKDLGAEESLILTPHTYAIGLSGMTGYPQKPENAAWLCLEVTVHPSSKPIDTLDLLWSEPLRLDTIG